MSDQGTPISSAHVQNSAPSNDKGNTESTVTSQETASTAAKETIQKWKLKVDGKEEDVDLETLKREYPKIKGADKRFEEAAKVRKEAESFIELLKKDPRRVMEDPRIGIDLRKFAEDYLKEQLEQEMLDPKERKLREYEKKLKEVEEREAESKKQEAAKQREALVNHYTQEYDKKIAEALNSSGLPRTPRTVARMAALMERNIEFGLDLEPADLIDQVRASYVDDIKELFSQTEGDILLQILGDEVANKIRQSDLKRLRGNMTPANAPKRPVQPALRDDKTKKHISIHEWRDKLDKRFG